MEIIGQGIISAVVPYLHLGYVSAYCDYQPLPPDIQVGPVLLGLCAAAVPALFFARDLVYGMKPRWYLPPLILMLLFVGIGWGTATRAAPAPDPMRITSQRGQLILMELNFDKQSEDTAPYKSLRDPRLELALPYFHGSTGLPGVVVGDRIRIDYWGREFRLRSRLVQYRPFGIPIVDKQGKVMGQSVPDVRRGHEYSLVSAGSDGRFGTADDIVIDYPGP